MGKQSKAEVISNGVFKVFIPFVDMLLMLGSTLLSFYIFKNILDNFLINYFSFMKAFPFVATIYWIMTIIFNLKETNNFSFLDVVYPVFILVLILFFISLCITLSIRELAYPISILAISSVMQIVVISIWHFVANLMYQRVFEQKENLK